MVDIKKGQIEMAASTLGVQPEEVEKVLTTVFPEISGTISKLRARADNNCFNCAETMRSGTTRE